MRVIQISEKSHHAGMTASHCHDCWEFIVAVSGRSDLIIEGHGTFSFCNGNIILIPPNKIHHIVSEGDYSKIAILFDGLIAAPVGKFIFSDDERGTFLTLSRLMLELADKKSQEKQMILNSLGDAIFALFLERTRDSWSISEKAERLRNQILLGYQNPEFTVTDAFLSCGFSEAHLRHRFHEAFDMTPNAYLTKLRIERACRLLESEPINVGIVEIAHRSGFFDPHYFARSFRKHLGLTPTEFRNQHAGQQK